MKRKIRKEPQSIIKKHKERLKSSKFRWLNEKFYKETSENMEKYFKEHPEDFNLYHYGFSNQILKWNKNPVDVIIQRIEKKIKDSKNKNQLIEIADLGCGKAKIQDFFDNKDNQGYQVLTYSIDLFKYNDKVIQRNISNTLLDSNKIDYVIFCLSLMGTDYPKFIAEGIRILKPNGLLFIVEALSRVKNYNNFINEIVSMGAKFLRRKLKSDKFFIYLEFTKINSETFPNQIINGKNALNPCLYKKR